MKYYTYVEPDEKMEPVFTTLSEDQIIDIYFKWWSNKMEEADKCDEINHKNCIEDWCIVNWASETDKNGNTLIIEG